MYSNLSFTVLSIVLIIRIPVMASDPRREGSAEFEWAEQRRELQASRDKYRDEQTMRRRQEKTMQTIDEARRFLSSDPSCHSRNAFQRLFQRCSFPSEIIRSEECSEVGPIADTGFCRVGDSYVAKVISPDGQIAMTKVKTALLLAGRCGACQSDIDRADASRIKLQQKWSTVCEILARQGDVSEMINALDGALTELRIAVERITLATRPQCKDTALAEIDHCRKLPERLHDPEFRQEVRDYVHGVSFQGGTLADLVDFMLEHNVSIRHGTEEYAKVAALFDHMACEIAEREGLAPEANEESQSPLVRPKSNPTLFDGLAGPVTFVPNHRTQAP